MKILLIILLAFFSTHDQNGTIKVKITNIDFKKGGDLLIGVFDKSNFLKEKKELYTKKVVVNKKSHQVILSDIKPGEYAIAISHDINQNGKLEKNFVGYPKEPVGFSNNAPMKFGPPSYKDAKFEVTENDTTLLIIKMN